MQQGRILSNKVTTVIAIGFLGAVALLVRELLPTPAQQHSSTERPVVSSHSAPTTASGLARSHAPPTFVAAERGSADEIEREEPRARAVLATIIPQMLEEARAFEPLGLEAAGNSMEPYLRGAFATLRATNPSAVTAMKTALADRVCKETIGNLELMLFAHIAAEAPEAASPRALDCALQHHPAEDVLLWKLLDAWHGSGLPPSDVIKAVEARAKDPRTTRRFSRGRPEEGLAVTSQTPETAAPSLTAQERTHERK